VSVSQNKEIVRRYFEGRFNDNDAGVVEELVAPNVGIEDQKEFLQAVHAAFEGLHVTIHDLIAEDDQVVVHYEMVGTHRLEWLGIAPSGKRLTFRGMALLTVRDGKIVKDDVVYSDHIEVLLGMNEVELPSQRDTGDAS
jgi:predicted ester cyclase